MKTSLVRLFITTAFILCRFGFPAGSEGQNVSSVPLDSALWTAQGEHRQSSFEGVTQVALGQGLVRFDWADGRSEIRGLMSQNCPVIYQRSGKNVLWRYDLEKKAQLLSGATKNEVKLPDGRLFYLISNEKLTLAELATFASVITNSPKRTFKEKTFYVIGEIGEVQSGDGKFYPLGGLHDSATDAIFVKREIFSDYTKLAFIIRHEIGHSWDEKMNWISQSLMDASGDKLFGKGSLLLDESGSVDLKRSGFSSVYATTNSGEDFAETHELLLRLREEYLKSKSVDLLSLNPAELKEALSGAGLSPLIQQKLSAVCQSIYHEQTVASAKEPMQAPVAGAHN